MRTCIRSLVLAAGLMAPATALAQPAIVADLGTVDFATPTPIVFNTGGTAAGEVKWWKFTIAAPVKMADLKFLDIFTQLAGLDNDCEIAVYDAAGNLVSNDDDDGISFNSQLTFGAGQGTVEVGTSPTVRNGRDGDLAAGSYYLAVSRWQVAYGTTGFGFTADGSGFPGDPVDVTLNPGTATAVSPAGFIDLGTVVYGTPKTRTDTLAAAQVRWYKVALPNGLAATSSYVDMDTEGSTLAPTNSTRLTLYGANGAIQSSKASLISSDTVDGSGTLSQLTFGLTLPTRSAVGDGLAYNGRDGELRAATYYIAVSSVVTVTPSLATSMATNFGLTSTSANTGNVKLNINANQGNTPPSGVGTAIPTFGGTGTPVTLRVTVTPGTLPASTGLVVTGDTLAIGGGPITFLDNGVPPDALLGDNIFTASAVVGPGLPSGPVTIPFTITDAQSRTGTGNIAFQVVGPAPACPTGGESFSATNINSDGDYGTPANGVYTFTPTGTGQVTQVRFSGRFIPNNNYAFDCLIGVEPPLGTGNPVYFYTFGTGGGIGVPRDVTIDIPVTCGADLSAGEWTVIAFEDIDDGGVDGVWSDMCVTLVAGTPTPGTWSGDCSADAGDLPATAQAPVGSGALTQIDGTLEANGIDMYKITICNPAAFSATTVGSGFDTQLFLFNLDGTGVIHNDDDPASLVNESTLDNSGGWIAAPGDYYLAVGLYNRDPADEFGQLIWNNAGPGGEFDTIRTPDGPGSTGIVSSWLNATGGGAGYSLILAGTCFPSGGAAGCNLADITEIGGSAEAPGNPDNQLTVDDIIVFVNLFSDGSGCPGTAPCSRADVTGIGGPPELPDGQLTVDDIIGFFNAFSEGCPA